MVMRTMKELYEEALTGAPSRFEAGELYRLVTGLSVHDFPSIAPTAAMRRRLGDLLEKRRAGVPLQYLLGQWEFYSLPFQVGPGVLIPRQDTETLVDAALEILRQSGNGSPVLLDLCSGSGCVAVAIKANLPGADVTALEFSAEAFAYLAKNIALNRVVVRPVLSDLREYTHPEPLDMIVSNPPYIPRGELHSLQTEVCHEPIMALDGGEDGMHYFRAIARRYKAQLKPGGTLLVEIGAGQQSKAEPILEEHGFSRIRGRADLNGIVRVLEAWN